MCTYIRLLDISVIICLKMLIKFLSVKISFTEHLLITIISEYFNVLVWYLYSLIRHSYEYLEIFLLPSFFKYFIP